MMNPVAMTSAVAQPMIETIPRSRASSGIVVSLVASVENLLDRHVEQPREPEGERQRRVVFPRLDCVDRLLRHVEQDIGTATSREGVCHEFKYSMVAYDIKQTY